MDNPTSDGMFDEYDSKHDCPRPLAGCRYPKCDCDVDGLEISEALTVTVNKKECKIAPDFGTSPQEFAKACGYNEHRRWKVYRKDNPKMQTGPEDRCEEPMVVSDGDQFVIVPQYVSGG